MSKESPPVNTDDLRPEYDLTELLEGGVCGKYAERLLDGSNMVLLESDVAKDFPTAEAVNKALRLVMKWKKDRGCEPRMEPSGADCEGRGTPSLNRESGLI